MYSFQLPADVKDALFSAAGLWVMNGFTLNELIL